MLIIYTGRGEILITTSKGEKKMIKEWFSNPLGRDIKNFKRINALETEVLLISTGVIVFPN